MPVKCRFLAYWLDGSNEDQGSSQRSPANEPDRKRDLVCVSGACCPSTPTSLLRPCLCQARPWMRPGLASGPALNEALLAAGPAADEALPWMKPPCFR